MGFSELDIYKCPFLKIGGRELKFSYIIVFTYILKKEKYLPLPTCFVVSGCHVMVVRCLAALLAMVVASVLVFFFTVFPFAFAVIVPAVAVASASLVLALVLLFLINTL